MEEEQRGGKGPTKSPPSKPPNPPVVGIVGTVGRVPPVTGSRAERRLVRRPWTEKRWRKRSGLGNRDAFKTRRKGRTRSEERSNERDGSELSDDGSDVADDLSDCRSRQKEFSSECAQEEE